MTTSDSISISPETNAFLEKEHLLFIDGVWVANSSGNKIPVEDPATEEVISEVLAAEDPEVSAAVDAARRALDEKSWSRMAPSARCNLLLRLADLLDRDAKIITELEILDNGMPLNPGGALAVPLAARLFRYYAGWVDKIAGATSPVEPPRTGRSAVAYTRKEPVGVVAQITPWNYPLGMLAMKLGPALAVGCTVVLKPAEQTPLTALYVASLIEEAGFPAGVVNIIPGLGETAGAALARHPGVDKVAFTGSTDVGRLIIGSAAENLKKVSLELGGKSPFVVFDDADLRLAIQSAAFSSYFLQGQNCMCSSRIFVQDKIYSEFVESLANIANGMKVGIGLDPSTQIGPLISKDQRDRVREYVRQGEKEGAELVCGGKEIDRSGYFMSPALFASANENMTVTREEIFGPVTCVQCFSDIDEAIHLANATDFGLVGSVWTEDLNRAHTMVDKIRAGTIGVNNHGLADITLPFGGYKQSGWGREFGPDSIDLYTQTKTVSIHY